MFVTNWTENVNHFTSNHLLHSNFGNAGVDKPIGIKLIKTDQFKSL
jgi:hypothetical protein